ncbi:hypothetical protein SAY87_019862 [Trapa incisa]|uniref:non-specific serine/threonine protein kinase n=1 Tax=Trapa incisa TaxID=236973 RepID=A0AAN7K2K0_9MYRT|nr:hypothetical protein SAY87_019862 [Trapa incisa]
MEMHRSRCPLVAVGFFFLVILGTSSAAFDNITFNFSSFDPADTQSFTFYGYASLVKPNIELTANQQNKDIMTGSVGWAMYHKPMHLWDNTTGKIADFTTQFSFIINSQNRNEFGDGVTFFLTFNGSQIENLNGGGGLALPFINYIIAVEFDTFSNAIDPEYDPSSPFKPHIGIDINSVNSSVTDMWEWNKIKEGGEAQARITYDSSTKNLNVLLVDGSSSDSTDSYPTNKNFSSVSYVVDLREHLPEWVSFGFSGSTGYNFEIHEIKSWYFASSLQIPDPPPETSAAPPETSAAPPAIALQSDQVKEKSKTWVWIVIVSCVVAVILSVTIVIIRWFHRSSKEVGNDERAEEDHNAMLIDEELEKMAGPRKFSYKDLAIATNDFERSRLLGEGGFGMVYQGYLSDLKDNVAIKKIRADSKQGLKEYVAEVKAVSQLRHRSLVQLLGWCHRGHELLIIYNFMSNGSLDSHLFKHKTLLTWETRYKIALDVASAILYLHEDWSQCIVHRDIKCSNIMLDSNFDAKLGDFGLARIIDHGKVSQTTTLAGTMGYMAPECVYTGRASKESDVYSFGVIVLEIACGRSVIEPLAKVGPPHLVQWVWELYGDGKLLDAADPVLEGKYNTGEMEMMMVVGLWCCHPDYSLRPSIQEAFKVLKLNGSPPLLPPKMPVPTFASPLNMPQLSLVSSYSANNSYGISLTSQSSAYTSSTSTSDPSPPPLLQKAR